MRDSDAGQRSFEELFARFGHLECALDHDKFYSLYGMVKDTMNLGSDFPLPDFALCITEVFMQQLLRWENQFPVQSPMNFVLTFIRHFPQAIIEVLAIVTARALLSSGFLFVVQSERIHRPVCDNRKVPLFCVQRENDIYRFRRFTSADGCFLREGDLAFDLEFQVWNLVVPQCEDNCRQDVPTQRTIEVIGFVYHGPVESRCFSLVNHLTGFATETEL
jgi:hypothetical protein